MDYTPGYLLPNDYQAKIRDKSYEELVNSCDRINVIPVKNILLITTLNSRLINAGDLLQILRLGLAQAYDQRYEDINKIFEPKVFEA